MARTTYEKLQRQIATLQAQADKLRRKEVDEVIERMRTAIAFYGITAQELGFSDGAAPMRTKAARGAAAKPAAKESGAGKHARKSPRKSARKSAGRRGKAASASQEARYRDENGNAWVGRGKRPQWLRDALAAGRTLDEFRVAPA